MKYIKSIKIKNSSFFKDNFEIQFSKKLNCIMGGRGTGKTTLLYFILSSLKPDAENEKIPFSILKNNLDEGEIIVDIVIESGKHLRINKYFGEEPQFYLMPDEEVISYSKAKKYIEVDIHEASAIEEIGRNGYSRLELIDKTDLEIIETLVSTIKDMKIDLDENGQEIISINSKINNCISKLDQYKHSKEEFEKHKKNPPADLDLKEDKIFNIADKNEKKRIKESKFLENLLNQIERTQDEFDDIKDDYKDFVKNNIEEISEYLNQDIIKKCIEDFSKLYKTFQNSIHEIETQSKQAYNSIKQNQNSLKKIHLTQQNEFVKLKQKIQKHKEYYKQYNELSKKEEKRISISKDKNILTEKRNKLKLKREKLIVSFNDKKQELFEARLKKVNELNLLFKNKIKISLTFGGLSDKYEDKLRESLKGTGLRYNELIPRIVQNFSPDKFANLVHNSDYKTLKAVTGIDDVRSKTVIDSLFQTNYIYEIESIYCHDLPDFYLKVEKDESSKQKNYKKSDELSTGQRCTTVLPIVFSVSSNPLIIDQPEDNLDNKYITGEIFTMLETLKNKRQLIFITHNPNIPVLPNAELNVFIKYDKKAIIDNIGNVDNVKINILDLLEGGEKAFEKRKEIYGI